MGSPLRLYVLLSRHLVCVCVNAVKNVSLVCGWLDYALGEGAWISWQLGTGRRNRSHRVGSTGFGPFEKPSAPAFSVHAEIRALC